MPINSASALHWRNLNPLGEDAFEIFEAGGFSGAVCMSNMGLGLPLVIASRYPQALLIARLFMPAGILPTVDDAVAEWTPYIGAVKGVCKKLVILNEPGKEYPDVSPEDFSFWFMKVRAKLKKLFADCDFGFPMPEVIGEAAWDYIARSYMGITQADFLGEHCYWDEKWQATDWNWGARYLRIRQAYPDKPIYITEYGCSADLDADNRAAQYREWLLALPDWITFSAAYIQAGADGWERFWIDADMARAMRIENGGETMPEYAVGMGIKAAMAARGEAPVEDEQYLWPGKYSVCASNNGLYFYSFASNAVYRLPKV